ncbi:restriction endonuclease subunit S [Metamycoplasma equirhinis]|uniref:restriction endonuclease subunit S n=1 Tax=Metamycoplasma equirhinis TaxID=92402 RepID=UPI0035940610
MKLEQITSVITDYVANGSFASLKENAKYVSKEEGYARVIRLTDENSDYSDNDSIYVSKESYEFLSKSKLHAKDIIVTNVGAYLGTVFQCPNLDTPMTLGPNAILIKPNNKVINDYLYYLLYSKYGHNKLVSLVSGSAMPKFNKTDLKKLEIKIHDIETQQHIVNTILSHFFF